MSRWTRFVERRRDAHEKWDDLTPEERIDRLRSGNRSLRIALLALIVAGGFAALLFRLQDNYLAERAKLRNDQASTVACATIYDANTDNPYVRKLIRDHPECPVPARLAPFVPDGSGRQMFPPATVVPSTAAPSRGSQVQSPVSPTQGPTGDAVRPGAGESRTRSQPNVTRSSAASAPRTANSPAGTSPGGATTTSAPRLCLDLPLGPLRTRLGC